MSERVRMLKQQPVVASGELEAAVSGPDTQEARRFSMTVAEEALARMGPVAIEHVAQRLAEQVAHEQHRAVTDLVHSFLLDRKWAEPIIHQAIEKAVRELIRDMLAPKPREAPHD